MFKLFLSVLALSSVVALAAPSPFIYGPDGTAQNLAPNGIYPAAQRGVHLFDDFITGCSSPNINISTLGWNNGGNAGGGLAGFVAGSCPDQQGVGHIGVVEPITGTNNNNTANGAIYLTTAYLYPGQAKSITMQFEIKTPAALSGTPAYVMDLGCLSTATSGTDSKTGSGAFFRYKQATDTHWMAETCNNGTCTESTTSSSTFTVVAATWYVFKIVMTSANIVYSMAAAGSQSFTTLATVSTNLPDSADTCYPALTINKSGTASVTSTGFFIDWFSLDIVNSALR